MEKLTDVKTEKEVPGYLKLTSALGCENLYKRQALNSISLVF